MHLPRERHPSLSCAVHPLVLSPSDYPKDQPLERSTSSRKSQVQAASTLKDSPLDLARLPSLRYRWLRVSFVSELLSHPKRVLCWWGLTVHFTALVGPPIHLQRLLPDLRQGLRIEVIEINQLQGLFLFLFFTPPADPNIAHA